MITFEVQPYSHELQADIARLFQLEGFERTSRYQDWIFHPPEGGSLVALARDQAADGKLIGVLGFVSWQVLVLRQTCKTYMAIDLVVDPSYRGRGIFMGLGRAGLDAAAAAGAAFVWGFPNANAAHGWFNRFGWERLGTPPVMVRPLRSSLLTRRLWGSSFLDFPLIFYRKPEFEIRSIDRFGPDMDALWEAASGTLRCATVRDSNWLNWRVVDAPESSYRRVGAYSEGRLVAIAVTTRAERRGLRLLYLVEALCASPVYESFLDGLLRHELGVAAGDGVDLAVCWSPRAAPNHSSYRKVGFLSLPLWLHPSETHFGVKRLARTAEAVAAAEAWYISYLNADSV